MSWKSLINGLALLVTGFGIVISVTIGIVTSAANYPVIEIGTYDVSTPIFLLLVLPSALIVLAAVIRAILLMNGAFRRRKSNG